MSDIESQRLAYVASATALENVRTKVRELQEELSTQKVEPKKDVGSATDADPNNHVHVRVKREPLTYERGNGRSYFQDLMRGQALQDEAAQERLARHRTEMAVELRAASSIDGAGGEFDPPLWAIPQTGPSIAAGRILPDLIDRVGNLFPLPRGVDQVNVPKITTGVADQIQSTDGAVVTSQDELTSAGTADVVTIAGEMVASQQLLDLTPAPGFDQIVLMDLTAQYNAALEKQLMSGTGANGQVLGLLNVSGIISQPAGATIVPANIAGTTNMIAGFWVVLGSLLAQTANGRQQPGRQVLMAPRRWAALAFGLDQQGRPVSVPGSDAPSQPDIPEVGGAHNWTGAVGPVGGCPVWQSGVLGPASNVSGATGAGATDTVLVVRPRDFLMWESQFPSFAVRQQVLGGTLQVRLQLRKYVSAVLNRYPSGIGAATGLIQPTTGLTGFTF